ncbi:ABC transporter ATP-binding protein [Agrobacterium tumefaciens]|uniref:ABC transporter ATP-binding protein n=1 Tax=Rhizobium/Agrobacterium group TaxID=227290 RepID=UPI000D95D2F4|nr:MULTISPECIES: ABC transporter ATP-binding protein [Rhizobium/Agrobacterium group]NTE56346.1 ABC transporter ATP-binding protein [Agrobacterium tumefaciens]NTE69069.1 ABC transporter ATP-binding protein [Agrobacterium tumefaciens]PYG55870.1 carbohydrate ABC transporter ATP-binding protein (CUT1 family) [Rhizobium sp. UGM030330-04]
MGVRLNNIAKSFGSFAAIRDVSMEIPTGSFAVFVGPSGCGKSTLLRMIAGLEETSGGRIAIDDRDVTAVEPADRGVAMVFQNYALYPHLTVFENMAFSLRLARRPKAEVNERVGEASRILQLDEHLHKRPSQLSGGQRQRVAIGRAIVRQPKVFLFDEPLSNLDAELRVQMRLELTRLHRKLGATMIYVTHDQVEAMTLADRIFVLKGGIVQQAGAPLTLYDDPDNRFVAGFIGSPAMNFLQADVVEQRDGRVTLALEGGERPLEARLSQPVSPGQRLEIGIRPEHLAITDEGVLPVIVEVAEELGDLSYLYTRTGAGKELIVQRQGSREQLDGRSVSLNASPDRILVFDSDGKRLR